jgi:hypothetical protein
MHDFPPAHISQEMALVTNRNTEKRMYKNSTGQKSAQYTISQKFVLSNSLQLGRLSTEKLQEKGEKETLLHESL